MVFPKSFYGSLPSLEGSRDSVCALSSQSASMPNGWELWAHGPGTGRAAAAAKCSFLEVQATWILRHWENIHSLDVVHRVTFSFEPGVRTRIRILERDTVQKNPHFSPFRETNKPFPLYQFMKQITNFSSITLDIRDYLNWKKMPSTRGSYF